MLSTTATTCSRETGRWVMLGSGRNTPPWYRPMVGASRRGPGTAPSPNLNLNPASPNAVPGSRCANPASPHPGSKLGFGLRERGYGSGTAGNRFRFGCGFGLKAATDPSHTPGLRPPDDLVDLEREPGVEPARQDPGRQIAGLDLAPHRREEHLYPALQRVAPDHLARPGEVGLRGHHELHLVAGGQPVQVAQIG